MNRRTILPGLLVLMITCIAWSIQAQENIDFDKVVIKTTKVADGFYVLEGGGGNVTVFAGSDGVLLVDSQYGEMHQKVMDAVAKISTQPIRFLINTHFHADHTGGNEFMAKHGVIIVAQENVRKRLSAGRPAINGAPAITPSPKEALPVVTFNDSLTLHFNGEEISVIYPGPASTDGDSFIYFHRANIISTGDLPAALRYVAADLPAGGTINGQVVASERILKTANPTTKILPGHGMPVITVKDAQDQHDMLVALRDRVLSAVRAGKTLGEIGHQSLRAGIR